MEWWGKAGLTALAVWLVMSVARRHAGLAGLTAALPLVTGPTLAWIAWDRGTAFAVHAAVGSVAACALLAAFALGYGLAARRGGVAGALVGGLAPAVALLPVALGASERLHDALLLALGCTLLAELGLARAADEARQPDAEVLDAAFGLTVVTPAPLAPATALSIGAFAALADAAGPALGGFATGLLASLPIVGATMVVREHSRRGQGAARLFLRGYVRGLVGKAGFGAVLALTLPSLGLPLAFGLAGLTCWATALPALGAGRRAGARGA